MDPGKIYGQIIDTLESKLGWEGIDDFFEWTASRHNISINDVVAMDAHSLGTVKSLADDFIFNRQKPAGEGLSENQYNKIVGERYSGGEITRREGVADIPSIGAGGTGRQGRFEDRVIEQAIQQSGLTVSNVESQVESEYDPGLEYVRQQLREEGMPEWAVRSHRAARPDGDPWGGRSPEEINRLIAQDVARTYSKPRSIGGFGAAPVEFYRTPVGDQSFIARRQARTSGGGFGRALNDELKNDLERVLKASVKENYHREIPTDREVNTGVLLQAIEQASFDVNDVLSFTYELADLPGEARPGRLETEQRPSVHKYAPLVFQGRQSINVSESVMVFKGRFGWRRAQSVAPAEPRPVLTLTADQLERIDTVLQKGITPEVEEWLANVDALV